jgi:hypothetical protein
MKDERKDDGKDLEKINHAQSLGDHWTDKICMPDLTQWPNAQIT